MKFQLLLFSLALFCSGEIVLSFGRLSFKNRYLQHSVTSMLFDDYNKKSPIVPTTKSIPVQASTELARYQLIKEPILTSIEYYACQRDLQTNVKHQINDWTLSEMRNGRLGNCPYSTQLLSIDGRRLVHIMGYDISGDLLLNVDSKFDRFRHRSSSSSMHSNGYNSFPVHLQESTHLYETFYSIPYNISAKALSYDSNYDYYVSADLYSCRDKKNQPILMSKLCDSIRFYVATASQQENNNDDDIDEIKSHYQTIALPPNMICLQALSSIDSATCVMLGLWETPEAYQAFYTSSVYEDMFNEIKSLVAEGIDKNK